jgi:hypothetical protein
VFADFQPKIPAAYRQCPLVLLGNIHPALQLEVLDQVDGPELVVADTMNFWITGRARRSSRPCCAAWTPHHQRRGGARAVRHPQHPPRRRRRSAKRGPHTLIIKRGEHGALLFDEEGIFAAPASRSRRSSIRPARATASRAACIGYLAAHRGKIDPHVLRTAMLYGTATASRCVEGVGTSKVQTLVLGDVEARVVQIRTLFELPR